jgi:hypothetical protein
VASAGGPLFCHERIEQILAAFPFPEEPALTGYVGDQQCLSIL